jgi:Domain of unknown function (DUF4129)
VLLQAPIPAGAIRDSIARIVLERGYRRSATSTLLSRFWDWISDLLSRLFADATGSRGTYILSLTFLAAIALTSIARALIVARARRQAAGRRDAVATADELLAHARSLAAQGAYTAAAHGLYGAVVARLVERRQVRRHPSKTVGDYARELRTAADPLAGPYREFAHHYDIVAYGDKSCDAARYAQLEALAVPLLALPSPATARAA